MSRWILLVHAAIAGSIRLGYTLHARRLRGRCVHRIRILSDGFIAAGVALTFLFTALYIVAPELFAPFAPAGWKNPHAVTAAGTLSLLLHTVFLYLSHSALGENWSGLVEVREGQRLVKHGVYAKIRHPMYTGVFFWTTGLILVTGNAAFLALLVLPAGVLVRIRHEESMLYRAFSGEYEEYRATTRMFL